jgi:HEAT repeat protein
MPRRHLLLPGGVSALLLLLAPVLPAKAAPEPPALEAQTCSLEGLMDRIRRGLNSQSEAYRTYLRKLLRESAVLLPSAELHAAFERETDPVMVEHLAAALMARTLRGLEPEARDAVTRRALEERDPAVRAATVRAMRRGGTLEGTGDLYERLLRDTSPEVRKEAALNLIEDNVEVYGGHVREAADATVAAAAASTDPEVVAKVLGALPTGAVGPESVRTLQGLLGSDSAKVRAAAVTALGGVPAEGMAGARESLAAMYRDEPAPEVRKAILESIARLGFSSAVPELRRLRDIDPGLAPEVDAWIRVLGMNLQEWGLLLREKQRLRQAR